MSALRRLVLVRHGETEGESSVRYHGVTDVRLSDLGREQMRQAARALRSERFDAVFTSTLQRSVEAARIIAPHVLATAVPRFDEINFGLWEGLTREEIEQRDPERYRVWRRQPSDFTYPTGDSLTAFRRRVIAGLHEILPAAPDRVLIVAHKGVIRTVITELLSPAVPERDDLVIDLGSIHVLVYEGDRWRRDVSTAASEV